MALAAETRPRAGTATLACEQALEEVAEAAIGAATAEHFLEIEATCATVVRRHVEFLARAASLTALNLSSAPASLLTSGWYLRASRR
ncbi:hypothetical protein G6F68_019432 [Rhizopus microsporus]|nr:hypothetical protein G6F68_019432 [Rhizopus microsporus]